MPDKTEEMFKVVFKLEKDENGYPPADWEGLWAKKIYTSSTMFRSLRGVSVLVTLLWQKKKKGEKGDYSLEECIDLRVIAHCVLFFLIKQCFSHYGTD